MTATRLSPLVPGWPLIGNLIELAANPVQFWVDAARRHGPVFRVRYPTAPDGEITVLAGIEANQFASRHGSELFTTRQYYRRLTRETGTDNYICALDGEAHAYFRKVMKPALSREALALFVVDMTRMVEAEVGSWADGQVIPVMERFQRLTLDELSLAASGCPMTNAQYASLGAFAKTFVGSGVAGRPGFLLKMPSYTRAKHAVHGFLAEHLAAHEKQPPGDKRRADLMDTVLNAVYPDRQPFNEADRIANAHLPYANGFVYAGRLCALMIYALLKHPNILTRVMDEIDAGYANGPPSLSDFRRMPTLRNCIKETHRRYPIAPAVPRYAIKTFEFEGYAIPEGSYVFIAIVVPHFDPRYFADPYTFDPDRFAPPRSEGQRANAYMPYGVGTHVCLSVGLVEAVTMATMAGLLRTVDLELHAPDYELRFTTDPVPGPEDKFCIRVRGRRRHEAVRPIAPVDDESLAISLSGLNLGPDELKRFAGGVERRVYEAGAMIIRQGEPAEDFFVVSEGEAEVSRAKPDGAAEFLARIGQGGYFGEIGLLHGVPRTATVRAWDKGDVHVLAIGRELFTHMAAEHDLVSDEIAEMAKRRMMVNQLAQAVPGLDRAALAKVSAHLAKMRFEGGEVVIRQGGEPDRFYVIVSGEAEVVNHHPSGDDIVLARLGAGEYFGEIGILQNRPRTATVRAVGEAGLEVLAIEREHFLALADADHRTGQAIADKALKRLVATQPTP